MTITWEQFEQTYKPIQNNITKREEYNGWLFETYGDDNKHISQLAKDESTAGNVWTIVDVDGWIMITNGWHYVNRFGYIVTEVPCDKMETIDVVDEDDKPSDPDDENNF